MIEFGKANIDGELRDRLLPIRLYLTAACAEGVSPQLRRKLLRTARNLDLLNGTIVPGAPTRSREARRGGR